ncbi:MAG TPA: FtsX-like permease family protein [Thermomicrobiales bacterium]|nr:FtsX-like permease family protein [Thermomicrobiales bacterium]
MRAPAERRLPAIMALPRVSGITLRRLPSEPRLLLLALVVCASAFILSATPRYLERVSDDGIREAVRSVPARQSSISVLIEDRIGVSSDGNSFADLLQRGEAYHAGLPDAIRSVTAYQGYVADTPDLQVIDGHGGPLYGSQLLYNFLALRYQHGVWEHVTLTAGRMPAPREQVTPSEALGMEVQFDAPVQLFEIVMSEATAVSMHAGLGDRFLVTANFGSVFVNSPQVGPAGQRQRFVVEVVGFITVDDPDAAYWLGDTQLHWPDRSQAGEQIFSYGTALAGENEEIYRELYRSTLDNSASPRDWLYAWSFPAVPAAFDSSSSGSLANELRRLESTRGPVEVLSRDPSGAQIRSQLPAIIDTFAAQQQIFATTLALAAAGLVALSLVLLALQATLIVERRRSTAALMRGRGASTGQFVASQLIEGLIVVVPSAAIGLLAATMLVNAGEAAAPRAIALALAVAVILLLTGVAWMRLARPPLRDVERPAPFSGRRSQQRIVIEVAAIVMALLGVALLRRRGLDSGEVSDRGGLLSVDPYLALTPVLLAIAVGLAAARVLPMLAAGLSRVVARRQGLVPFFALRRMRGASGESALPLIALVLAVAVSSFSLIVADSISHGQREAALLATGADYRVESASGGDLLPEGLDLAGLPGIEAVAMAAVVTGVAARTSAPTPDRVTLIILEPEAYQRVIAGTTLSSVYDVQLDALANAQRGDAVPSLVSPGWINHRELRVGDAFEATIGSRKIPMVVQGPGLTPPGIAGGALYAIVSRADIARADAAFAEQRPTHIYARVGDDAEGAIAAALGGHDDATRIVSRAGLYEQSRASPLTGGVATGFQLTLAVAAAFAALSSIAALVLSARQRGRDLGFLRTLGMSQGQALRMVLAEHVPLVLAATLIGGLLGVATAWAIEPGFDLSPFAGLPPGQTPLQVDLPGIAAVTVAITAVVALATGLFVLFTRRAQLGQLLRAGDE